MLNHILSVDTPDDDRSPLSIYTFISLHLIGSSIFILILLLTEFNQLGNWLKNVTRRRKGDGGGERSNRRHHAWRSFCVSWIVFGFSYTIGTCVSLVRYGVDGMDRISFGGVERVLCGVQAGMIYAAPVLVANTTLGLIIQLRSVMLYGMQRIREPMSSVNRILIAIIPWILWVINLSGILIYTFKNPSLLEMNESGTYCHLTTPIISRVMASWLAVVASIAVGIEVYLVVLMYKRGFRLAEKCDASRTAMRVAVFMLQAIAMVGVALVFIFTKTRGAALDIIISAQTPFCAILFGMRTSILCCSTRREEEQLVKDVEPIRPSSINHTTSSQHHADDSIGSVIVIARSNEENKSGWETIH